MKNMISSKKYTRPSKAFVSLVLFSIFSLTACGHVSQASDHSASGGQKEPSSAALSSEAYNHPFLHAQTTIFHSLNASDGEPATVDLDVYLSETDGEFLFVEALEDCTAKISYTYSTDNTEGITLGYYAEDDGERHSSELTAAAPEAYQIFWTEESVSLKKGMNVFFLSGNDKNCKMHLELSTDHYENFSYVNAFPKSEIREQDAEAKDGLPRHAHSKILTRF